MKKMLFMVALVLVGCKINEPTYKLLGQRESIMYQMRSKHIQDTFDIIWMEAMDNEVNKIDSLIVILNNAESYTEFELLEE